MFTDSKRIDAFLERGVHNVNIAVIGDVMLDLYYFGEVKRISPEAPVPVTRVLEEKAVLGGAANVAQNLAKLGCKVHLLGVAGNDYNRRRLCQLLDQSGIDHEGLVTLERPTTTKLRVIGGHQQMLRLDFEETGELDRKAEKALKAKVESLAGRGIACLIISDYAKGVCSRNMCQFIVNAAEKMGLPVIVDPKGIDWRKYSGSAVITPNLKELGEAAREPVANEDAKVARVAEKLRKRFNISNIIVTRSEKGLSLVNPDQADHIPTRAQEVFDVSGAGDTVIAVLGAAVAAGLPLVDAAQLANLAAGIAVGKLGTYAVSGDELAEAVRMLER